MTSSKRETAASDSGITANSLRQAIASRQDYQFHSALPKEFMLEQASEKNRIVLPKIEKSWGVQLPPEKYCLTGTPWTLKDMWESDDEDQEGSEAGHANGHAGPAVNGVNGTGRASMFGGATDGTDEKEEDEGMDSFEDVFGANNDEDQEMTEG